MSVEGTGGMTITDELVALTPAEPKRDRYGRPLIKPRDGGKPKAYTRPTTIADTLDDRYNLEQWKQRQVLLGTIARPDLHALAATTAGDDKKALNKLCEQLMDAAASDKGANMGTAVHAAVEAHNRGLGYAEMFATDVEAYAAALAAAGAEVDPDHVEQFVVNDTIGAAGTFDMRLRIGGRWYVADLKTGSSVEWSAKAFAIQLAIYQGHTSTYDWATEAHGDALELESDRGVIVHLPAGSGECTLHWIDLAAGREALEHALWVRKWRSRKNLLTPYKLDGGGTDDHSGASAVAVGTVEEPTKTTSRPRRPVTPPIKPVPADQVAPRPPSGAAPEGRELRQDEVDKLRDTIASIGDSVHTVTRWKDEATVPDGKAAGPAWGITDSAGRTERRYALATTACALAEFCHSDDEAEVDFIARQVLELVIGDDVQTHPVGRLIGVLTIDEAREVWKRLQRLTIQITEDDRPVIVPAA